MTSVPACRPSASFFSREVPTQRGPPRVNSRAVRVASLPPACSRRSDSPLLLGSDCRFHPDLTKKFIAESSKARGSGRRAPMTEHYGTCLECGLQSFWELWVPRNSVASLARRRRGCAAKPDDSEEGWERPTLRPGSLMPRRHFATLVYAFACFWLSLSFGIKLVTDAHGSDGECQASVCLLGRRPTPRDGSSASPGRSLAFGSLPFSSPVIFAEGVTAPQASTSLPPFDLSLPSACWHSGAREAGEVSACRWPNHPTCRKPATGRSCSWVTCHYPPVRSPHHRVEPVSRHRGYLSPFFPQDPCCHLSSCSRARECEALAFLPAAVRQGTSLFFSAPADHLLSPPAVRASCFNPRGICCPKNGFRQTYRARVPSSRRIRTSSVSSRPSFAGEPASPAVFRFSPCGSGWRPCDAARSGPLSLFFNRPAPSRTTSSPLVLGPASSSCTAVQRTSFFPSRGSYAGSRDASAAVTLSLASVRSSLSASPGSTSSGAEPVWLPYSFPERLLPSALGNSSSFEALRTARDHFKSLLQNGVLTPPRSYSIARNNLEPDGGLVAGASLTDRHREIFLGFAEVYAAEVAKAGTVTAQEYIDILT